MIYKWNFVLNLWIILLLGNILFLAIDAFAVAAEHRRWVVDDDGVADFRSIQEAVDASFEGDIIFVKSGLYRGPLWIRKSVYLMGEDMETTIIEANVTSFEDGVIIMASDVVLTRFTVRNGMVGISIWDSQNILITENIVVNNNIGIEIINSFNVTFHRNNFIYNFDQVYSLNSITFWDNGCEGNFWSDYFGIDDGSNGRIAGDGIGDTLIPHNNVDNFPLLCPWRARRCFSVKWGNQVYHVLVTSNSTVASFNFSQLGCRISFMVTGPRGSIGFCNVTIPKELLSGDFVVLVDDLPVDYVLEGNQTHNIIKFTYVHCVHLIEIVGEHTVEPQPPKPPPKPRRFRLLAIEQMFDGERMKSAQNLIKNLLRYPNWNNSTDEYVSFIHLLSMYGSSELEDPLTSFWQGIPSFANIKNEMENFLAQASPGEIVIFYYVGHTYIYHEPPQGLVYRFCGVSLKELKQWLSLGGLPQAYTILILDTCYSGYWTSGVLPEKTVLAACKQSQSAWGHRFEGHFTFGLLEGFWMAEDVNGDGWISAFEVFEHAKEYVETHFYIEDEYFKQNPQAHFPILDGDLPVVLKDFARDFPLWDVSIVSLEVEDIERIEPGIPVQVSVVLENEGDKVATVNLSLFCDGLHFGYVRITIPVNQCIAASFTLNTSRLYGLYANFTARITCSPGELDVADNLCQINKTIKIAANTDCNMDGVVDISDIFLAAFSFGASPGHSRWSVDADVNRDGYVGIDDMWFVAKDFGRIFHS